MILVITNNLLVSYTWRLAESGLNDLKGSRAILLAGKRFESALSVLFSATGGERLFLRGSIVELRRALISGR